MSQTASFLALILTWTANFLLASQHIFLHPLIVKICLLLNQYNNFVTAKKTCLILSTVCSFDLPHSTWQTLALLTTHLESITLATLPH